MVCLDASYLNELKQHGLESMKAATHRYARTQVRWIRNKLLYKCQQDSLNNNCDEHSSDIRIYLLDATCILISFYILLLIFDILLSKN
jgi:tRNA A37 N6-isopentenylltransferase MiaA